MVNVTLGEVKPQEKPFPKLMISDLGQIFYMLGINPDKKECLIGFQIHSNGYPVTVDGYSRFMVRAKFTDYNEPITLQNA
jgi:hypothetical protein